MASRNRAKRRNSRNLQHPNRHILRDAHLEQFAAGVDYLSQVQDRRAPRADDKTTKRTFWLLLREAVRRLWRRPRLLLQELASLLSLTRHNLSAINGLPHEAPAMHDVFSTLLARCESALLRLGIDPLPGVVIGSIQDKSVNAFSSPLFGSGNAIVLHSSTPLFAYLLTKAVTPLVSGISKGRFVLGVSPRCHRDQSRWRLYQLLFALVQFGDPARAPRYNPAQLGPSGRLADRLLISMELFIVAHEYAHLLKAHGANPDTAGCLKWILHDDEELFADRLGFTILFATAHYDRSHSAVDLVAPLIMFRLLGALEDAGLMPKPEAHPSSRSRRNALISFYRDELRLRLDLSAGYCRHVLAAWKRVDQILRGELGPLIDSLCRDITPADLLRALRQAAASPADPH